MRNVNKKIGTNRNHFDITGRKKNCDKYLSFLLRDEVYDAKIGGEGDNLRSLDGF